VKYFTVIFTVFILFFIIDRHIYADEQPYSAQEEAPATVWDFEIGDREVDLYFTGYWKIGVIGGASIESGPSGIIFPAAFPGLTDFRFYQEPDLTISLWLMNRFYLETSFLEGFDKNTYAIGYRGMEGEFLQTVRIGNSEIGIQDYRGLNVPSPKYNTPGISASFQTEKSFHDILFRYDPTSEHKKIFLGEYEITEEIIETDSYARGQFFILPDDNIDADSIKVYIADKDGVYSGTDGKNYRLATENEAYYSLEDGTVSLFEASETDVLVFYEKTILLTTYSVGDATLGTSFIPSLINGEPDPGAAQSQFEWDLPDAWYPAQGNYRDSSLVQVSSKNCLKVYNPKKFGPFELFNTYKINSALPADSWRTNIILADNSLLEASDSGDFEYRLSVFEYKLSAEEKLLKVFYSRETTDIRSPWSRYPLADSYPQLYGSEETDTALTGRSFLVSIKDNIGLNLGPGVVPGSEQIFINGYETSAASVDYNTGEMSFSKYIFPLDRIVVLYRTETTDLSGGDLLFAQGNRFYVNDNLQLHLAEMFRWNIAKKTSSTVDSTSPGGLTIAGGLNYKNENLNIELTSSLGLNTPDTTGILRLQGMEENGYSFSISEALLKQAPDSIWDGSAVINSGRADLTYTDYFSTNGFGQYFLNSYTWSEASPDPLKNGPSVASKISSDTFDSNVMVMEYDLAGLEWSAGDLLLSINGPLDLSRFTSLAMNFKKLDTTGGDIVVKILIGETGEREDWDDDGFIDSEDESLIVEIPATLPASDGSWSEFKHYFTPSEMKNLTKARSIRILIDDSSPLSSGRLLISGVHFDGSIFDGSLYDSGDTEISADDKLNVSEIENSTAYDLATDFEEVYEIFHPAGEEQKALKINWGYSTVLNAGDYWIAETNTSPVPADTYNNFHFYIKEESGSETYEISLLDSQDRGYSFFYTPASSEWEKLSLSLETGSVTNSTGINISTATINDSAFGELSRYRIQSSGSGSTAGTLYIDELHYSDPTFSIDGNVELITDYNYRENILATSSGFPILSDFSFSNQFRYSGGSVLSAASEGSNSIQNSTSLSIELMMLYIGANIKINWDQSSTDLSGSHTLQFPANFSYGFISDSYSRSGSGDSATMTRENAIQFNIPEKGIFNFTLSANGIDELLLQTWKAHTRWTAASVFNIEGSIAFEQNTDWSDWQIEDKGNYFSNWIYDYNLIAPFSNTDTNRSVQGSLNLNLDTKPVGFTFSPHMSFNSENSPLSTQTNRGGFTLSIPLRLTAESGGEWSIIPSYSRTFMEKSAKAQSDSFSDGFGNLFSDLGSWIPLTSFIPFYELFSNSTTAKFESDTLLFNEATYSPDFGISFLRKFGSNIYDLFLPYNISVHFIRNFSKKDDTFFNSNRLEFSFKQTAVNLFGNFGVYHKFDFYNTEDITSSLQFNLTVDGGNLPVPEELIYQNYLAFYGNNNGVFIVENRFETDFQDTYIADILYFRFIWNRPMKDDFRITFLNNLINKEHFWSHEENLGLEFQHPWDTNDSVTSTSISISIKHLSKLTVPTLGALRTWIQLGFFGDEELFRAGFEAGIELEVSF